MENHEATEWQEWDAFIASHLRYEDTSENFALLAEFFAEHGLDFNRDALHLAYTTLGNKLELTPFAAPLAAQITTPIEQQPSPVPTAQSEEVSAPRRGAFVAFRNGQLLHVHGPRSLQ